MDVCPNTYSSFPMNAPALTCGCAGAATGSGTVWGANPYQADSAICRAAVNAGAIPASGGQIVVTPAPKVPFFPNVTRNDVETSSYGGGDGFRIAVDAAAASSGAPAPAADTAPTAAGAGTSAMTMDICPNTYGSFPTDAPALSCTCAAEATE